MIPRTIHRIWVGGPMPAEFIAYGEGWAEKHPDWSMVLWTDSPQPSMPGVDIRELPQMFNGALFDRAEEIAPGHEGQLRADILRYEVLFRFGGLYVDADFECLRPIDHLIADIPCFAAWEAQDVWVNNAIMGSLPRHEFIRQLIERVPSNIARNAGQRPNVLTGPRLVTALYRERPDLLHVFDEALFYPYSFSELNRKGETFPRAFAVHHWNNARKRAQRRRAS